MKYHYRYYFFILVFLASFSINISASESVGSLRNVAGLATISRVVDDKRRIIRARNDLHIYQKDMIKTTQGNLGIIFNDSTRVSLARNSILVINRYVYRPGKKEYGMITNVMKGKAAVFSGQISNLEADAMVFKTPNATIRARNANFLIEVNDQGGS
ncbi:MAG: FecR domain-containing protein [Pseudomonadota bacterium]